MRSDNNRWIQRNNVVAQSLIFFILNLEWINGGVNGFAQKHDNILRQPRAKGNGENKLPKASF